MATSGSSSGFKGTTILYYDQGPDASTLQIIYNDNHSRKEDFLYSPTGQVTGRNRSDPCRTQAGGEHFATL